MRPLKEFISEAITDNYEVIKISKEVCDIIMKVGMSFTHEDDEFYIYKDGSIEYRNPYLFTIPFKGKIPKSWIGKVIPMDDKRVLKLQPHVGHVNDDLKNPYNYIKAILNAYANGEFKKDGAIYILTNIEYTRDDYKEDVE